MLGVSSPQAAASRRAWISVGAPILGLVALVAALAVMLVADFARKQDEAFAEESRRLVAAAVETHAHALTNVTLDYAVWSDAYRNITQHWRPAWVKHNFYSVVADGMLIARASGPARHVWIASAFTTQHPALIDAALAAARRDGDLTQLARAATTNELARNTYAVVDGRLVLIAISPISMEDGSRDTRRPVDYLITFDVIGDNDITQIAHPLGLEDFAFTPALARNTDTIALPFTTSRGVLIGGFEWRNERPGAAAFSARIWPIVLGLLMVGALALFMSLRLVDRHTRLSIRAESANDASRLKSEFIATMSHELRTPLNAIIGYTELIDEEADALGAPGAPLRKDAGRVLAAAKHLQQLVTDILDQSRIDAGRLTLKPEYLVVSQMLADITELMGPVAEAKGLAFIYHVEADANALIADQTRLRQCLLNLAGNALKFTATGSVRVNVCRHAETIVFDVIDTGIGIDKSELARLFSPFNQADGVQQRYGGVGLGLVTARKLARAMGGDIVVASAFGKGSTFTLTLPAIRETVANAA